MRQGGISEGQSTWEFQACGQPIDGKVIGKKWAAKHDGSSIGAFDGRINSAAEYSSRLAKIDGPICFSI